MQSWMNDVNDDRLATVKELLKRYQSSYLVAGTSGTLCVKENPVKRPSSQESL